LIPSILRAKSFCKINLALAVLGKRRDGFHEIRTVFQTIDLHDELELRPAEGIRLRCDSLPGLPEEDNLAWRAASRLASAFPGSPGVEIVLQKRVPAGSGLGGGSSNAASTLLALCRFWNVRPESARLLSLASSLGADVPFFLTGGTALGCGRGDEVSPLPDPATSHLVVVYPGVSVSTAAAYGSLNLKLTCTGAVSRINRFLEGLRRGTIRPAAIFNDFETSILSDFPAVREARDALIEQGAVAALLSGSGSSVFGFFRNEESALAASRALARESWRAFPAKTLSRVEYSQRMFGS